jgi:uncharacterized membrane protein
MSQWYCIIDGERYGPESFETVEQWLCNGAPAQDVWVWQKGMEDWQLARDVEAFAGVFAQGEQPALPFAASLGTDGTTRARTIIRETWQGLRKVWGISLGFIFLTGLIGAVGNIPYVGLILGLIVQPALVLAGAVFFLRIVRRQPASMTAIKYGFSNLWPALKVLMLLSLLMLLWVLPGLVIVGLGAWGICICHWVDGSPKDLMELVCVVGGVLVAVGMIAASLRYSQAFYILADNPDWRAGRVISESVRLMKGSKGRLMWLEFLLMWVNLGGLLLLGLGLLWTLPLTSMANARFYADLLPQEIAPHD